MRSYLKHAAGSVKSSSVVIMLSMMKSKLFLCYDEANTLLMKIYYSMFNRSKFSSEINDKNIENDDLKNSINDI